MLSEAFRETSVFDQRKKIYKSEVKQYILPFGLNDYEIYEDEKIFGFYEIDSRKQVKRH